MKESASEHVQSAFLSPLCNPKQPCIPWAVHKHKTGARLERFPGHKIPTSSISWSKHTPRNWHQPYAFLYWMKVGKVPLSLSPSPHFSIASGCGYFQNMPVPLKKCACPGLCPADQPGVEQRLIREFDNISCFLVVIVSCVSNWLPGPRWGPTRWSKR